MASIVFCFFLVFQQIFISEGHVLPNTDDRRRIVDEARSIIQSGLTVIKSVVEKVPDEVDNKKPNETDWNKFNQSLSNFLDQQIQTENNIDDQNLIQNIKDGFQNITEEFLPTEDEIQGKRNSGMVKQLLTGGVQQVSSNLNDIVGTVTSTTIPTPSRPPGFISNIFSQFTGNQANSTPQASSVTGFQNDQSPSTQAPNFFQNAVSNIISNFRPTTTTTPNPDFPGILTGSSSSDTSTNQNNIFQNIAQAIQNSFRPGSNTGTKDGLENGMEVFACMNMAKFNKMKGKDNNEE